MDRSAADATSQPMTLAVAATFTAEPLEQALCFWVDELSLPARIALAPYGQVFQALLDSSSALSLNQRGANVILVRLQDWEGTSNEDLEQKASEFAAAVETAARRVRVPFLVIVCPVSTSLEHARAGSCERAGGFLSGALAKVPGVTVINSAALLTLCGERAVHEPFGDRAAHVPYTPVFFTALATAIARWLYGVIEPKYKAVVVDCDDTLWAGVCGEDGPQGVAIDAAGRAIQEYLVACHDNGVLIALCSRNNETDVRAVFDARSNEMPLQWRHVVASRFGWSSKSGNIRALARELRLPLDAFAFLDNDPVECADVQANCPDVLTIRLPHDRDGLPQFLRNLWLFDHRAVTDEARARTALYRANEIRDRAREEAPSLTDFLARLDLKVHFSDLTPSRIPRASELTQRTNQFNLTGIRRSEADIEAVRQQGHECMTVHVSDRFGNYGQVGLIIFTAASDALAVDTFLLSCRALGKGVEHRMLKKLGQLALDRNLRRVDLPFVWSGRNAPALAFLTAIADAWQEASGSGSVFRVPAEFAAQIEYAPDTSDQKTSAPAAQPGVAIAEPPVPGHARAKAVMLTSIAAWLQDLDRLHEHISAAGRQRRTLDKEYVAPRTPTEETIATILAEVLGIDRVGIEDNFFALGGHSLLAMQVLFRIRDACHVELSPRLLYNSAFTVADLAKRVLDLQVNVTAPARVANLLDSLNVMSDDEVRTLLAGGGQAPAPVPE